MAIPIYAPEKEKQNEIALIVDEIISAKKDGKPYSETERKLNMAIYELFNIHKDEISMIEGK